jgi:hypothetical protein
MMLQLLMIQIDSLSQKIMIEGLYIQILSLQLCFTPMKILHLEIKNMTNFGHLEDEFQMLKHLLPNFSIMTHLQIEKAHKRALEEFLTQEKAFLLTNNFYFSQNQRKLEKRRFKTLKTTSKI